jgi:hypothetical protein
MLSGPDLGLREAVSFRHPDPRWTNTGDWKSEQQARPVTRGLTKSNR